MVRSLNAAAVWRRAVVTALLLSAASPAVLHAQVSTDQLVTQARYWEGKDRYDLAREAWLKLLRVDADNETALVGLGIAEAKSGKTAAAQVYLQRLREKHPTSAGIGRVDDAIRIGSFDNDRLKAPRKLAQEGHFDESVAAYREIYGGAVPEGRLGLEYWQTVAGTKDGWGPARDGLAALAARNPNDPTYRLALAQHLTYREETRREGITELARLGGEPGVGQQADQARAQALIWLGAKQGDEPLYTAYLANHQNAQVSAKLATVRGYSATAPGRPSGPVAPTADQIRGREVQQAYALLNDNRLGESEAAFQALLAKYPRSEDAIAGLGIVRLRQEKYDEAVPYLEQASAMAPGRAGQWRQALGTARFWSQVRVALAQREGGDAEGAAATLRRAVASEPAIAAKEPTVKITLADLLQESGDLDGAEALYKQVLVAHPGDVGATRGMVGILVRRNRVADALALAERLPPEDRQELGNLGALKGQYLREQAKLAADAGDDEQAETLLKRSLLEDPESAWTRMDLARLYQRQHRTREANTLVDGLLTGGRSMPDALFLKALLLAEQDEWLTAMGVLDQVPYDDRTQAMADLQRRLWVRYQTQRATLYAQAGRPMDAAMILKQVEPYAADSPETLGAMAGALADVGEDDLALNYMRLALSRQPTPDVGLRMQYGGLLFKLRQDAEFEVVMEELLQARSLTQQQSLDLANLRVAYRLRQADVVREQGNLARAYEYLDPLLRVNPNDPRVVMALARLYNDAKEYDKAIDLYARALKADPQNLDAYKGAITAELAMNQPEQAEALIDDAMRLDPENPRLYALAARAARARGEDGRALRLYQKALELDQRHGGPSEFGGRYSPKLFLLDPAATPANAPVLGQASPGLRSPLEIAAAAPRPGVAPAGRPTPRPAAARAAVGAKPASPVRVASRTPVVQAPAVPVAAVSAVHSAAPAPPRHRALAQGDQVLVAMPRWWKAGRLIKVSTAPEAVAPPPPPPPPPTAAGAGWVQTAPGQYQYVAPESGAGAMPRQFSPSLGGSDGRQAYPSGYPAGAARDRARAAGATPAAAPAGGPAPHANVPGRFGATEADYAQQGLRVVPNAAAPARDPLVLPSYTPTAPVAPGYAGQGGLPVAPIGGLQLRPDSQLSAQPDFTLDRRRTADDQPNEVLREIADINSKRNTSLGIGMSVRSRDGQSGLERLTDIETPVELSLAGVSAGRFRLRAVPVFLDAGTVSGTRVPFFGAMGLVSNPESYRLSQSESGVALGGVYDVGNLRLDVGSSPLGFPVETITGGINWHPTIDRWTIKLDLSRRMVTDSLLSYAGTRDPATGNVWGGVTENGGRVDLAYDLGGYGVYVNGGYDVLDGENVQRNSMVEAGTGFYVRALDRRDMTLTWGLNLTTFFYDKNLRRFTYGHGGYFSPQRYVAVAVPIEWAGGRDRFSYKVNAALGIQSFHEEATAAFPNDQDLQDAIEAYVEDNPEAAVVAGYPSKTSTGLGFNFGGTAEYLIAPNLVAGARVSFDNARDFEQASALGYLRFSFSGLRSVSRPPAPLLPYFDFGDPLQ